MAETKPKPTPHKFDNKEFQRPETLCVQDIENRVFQGIVIQCLSRIEGVSLLEGNFIDNIFSRGSLEGVKGIYAEQEESSPSVKIKMEVNIHYGYSIPAKAEEIQNLCREEITRLTGLHVSSIHVIFNNIILESDKKDPKATSVKPDKTTKKKVATLDDELSDEF